MALGIGAWFRFFFLFLFVIPFVFFGVSFLVASFSLTMLSFFFRQGVLSSNLILKINFRNETTVQHSK